jgi:arginyl-tRNA synthetase
LEARWGDVIVSDRPDLGDYQCNGALGAAKSQKKNPRELAQALVSALSVHQNDFQLSLAGPGFMNIRLEPHFLAKYASQMALDPRLGIPATGNPRKVVIDFGGPNVAKAMHVGHLRSAIIGDSLKRIYQFKGDEVLGDNHLGDWGSPMGMLICELKRRQPQLPYFDPHLKGPYPSESPVTITELEQMYPIASARFKSDEADKAEVLRATDELQQGRPGYLALWKHFLRITIEDMKIDFGRLGISFDLWLGESFYEDKMPAMVDRLKKAGMTEVSEGALIISLPDEMPPLILVKSGGGYLYHTSDLATVDYRVRELKTQLALYVVDKRQSLHFKQVFAAAKKAGIAQSTELVHVAFGTMNGVDGKPFKTREGGVLKLKDLMEMVTQKALQRLEEIGAARGYEASELQSIADKVALATLKYADLKNSREADYTFDLDKFTQFEGATGPYLLYSAVRIKSILRKAHEAGVLASGPQAVTHLPILPPAVEAERKLLLHLAQLPDSVDRAYAEREPHHLCHYGYELAQAFNFFYRECHILREENSDRRNSWLALCSLSLRHLEQILNLLGISVPERM